MSREARVSCLESLRVRNNRMATLLADEQADDAGASTDHRQGRRRPEGVHPFETALHIGQDRKSTRLNSSHLVISYAVFCLKKKKKNRIKNQSSKHAYRIIEV